MPSLQFKQVLERQSQLQQKKIYLFILFYLFILLFSDNKVLTFHVNHLRTKCHHSFLLFHFFLDK